MHDKRRISKQTGLTLAATAAIVMLGMFLFTHNEADVDLWGNVGFVRHFPGTPGFHLTNTFSFTEPDYPWVNHEWLAEYILHHTHRAFGNPGLLILKAMLGFALIGILNRGMRKRCESGTVRVLLLAIAMSTIGYGFSTRPHLFTYILIAALLRALLRPTPHPVLLLIAAPLGCLWANLHGAFFIGQILLILATGCAVLKGASHREASWRPALLLALTTVAFFVGSLLTPYGISLWDFISQSAAIVRPILSEWGPFNPLIHFSDHIDFMVLACITFFCVLLSIRQASGFALLVLALSFVAAIVMRRNIPIFAIVALLVATPHVDKMLGWQLEDIVNKLPRQMIMAMLVAAALISGVFLVRTHRAAPLEIVVPRDQFPIEAMAFLERNAVHANALVFFDWAEYAIWKLHPECHVFLDGRFRSAYSKEAIEIYLNFIYAGKDPLAALRDYPTDLVFVHVDNPCTALMRERKAWVLCYQDSMAAIFVKRDAHVELLRKLAAKSAYLPGGAPLEARFP
jgi:hypothetical protein